MAWAETSDKLRRADADLRRMQRAQQLISKLLKVVDTLIAQFMICKTLDVYTTLHVSYVTLPLALEGYSSPKTEHRKSFQCSVFGDGYLGLGDTLMIFQVPMAESHMKHGVLYIHPEFYISCVFYQRA